MKNNEQNVQNIAAENAGAPGMPMAAAKDKSRPGLMEWVMRKPWVLVLATLALVYVITYLVLPGRVGAVLTFQVIVPAMWLAVAAGVYFLDRWEGKRNLIFRREMLWLSLLVGAFHLAAIVIGGIFLGIGESPYASTLLGMAGNLVYVVAFLMGMELCRSYVVSATKDEKYRGIIIGVMLVFLAVNFVSPSRWASLDSPLRFMEFMGQNGAPNLAESLLATYLAFIGGPVAAIGYRAILNLFEWFSPVLPDLPWIANGLAGIFAPMLGLLIIQAQFAPARPERAMEAVESDEEGLTVMGLKVGNVVRLATTGATALLALVLVTVLALNIGVFGFKSMVVITGSMEPVIDVGDVVITKQVSIEDLQVNDVIKYHRNGIDIVHRVIGVEARPEGVLLTTKGDANNAIDRPSVTADELRGLVTMRVPKVGWFTIWVNQR